MPGLKPCPFCGHAAGGVHGVQPEVEEGVIRRVFWRCGECGATGPYVYMHHHSLEFAEAEALRLWNVRVNG